MVDKKTEVEISADPPEKVIARLRAQLADAHEELNKTNSELIQLTLELEDRVAERTEALRRSEEELRRHRDHLQERVNERTQSLNTLNDTLKKKLEELQASEERFRSLVLTIPDIVYRIDHRGRFTFINDAIQKLGYNTAELIGKHFSEIIQPGDVDSISRKKILPKLAGKEMGDAGAPKLFDERRTGVRKTTGLEIRLVAKNRNLKPGLLEKIGMEAITVEVNSAGLYSIADAENRHRILIGTVGVIRDITERKRIEHALKESEERLRTILDYAQAGIVVIDAETRRIADANPAAVSMIGTSAEKIIGSVCHNFICPSERENCPVLDLNMPVDNSERMLLRADGSQIPILKTVAPIQLNGQPHLLESFVDISNLKQTEEALRIAKAELEVKVEERTAELRNSQAKLIQTEKIAAIGTLTAGIAHELNNPMMGMINFIQYCIKHTDREHRTYPVLKDAEQETRRCARIVANLLTFSRIEDPNHEKLQQVSMEVLFDRVCRLLSYRIEKENVSVEKDIAENVPRVQVKVSNMQQVFLNLMGNALDAMREIKEKKIRFVMDRTDDCCRIRLEDSGSGISKQHVHRIFDPFFTTKPVGEGTGLGLSVSQGIVQDHGGSITCSSEAGRGTVFTILLPLSSNLTTAAAKGDS